MGRKICVVGGYSFKNFGDELTYYSLYHVLKKMGHDVLMASWPIEYKRFWSQYSYPGRMWLPSKEAFLFDTNPYDEGDIYKRCKTRKELKELNHICDTFIVGSGQYFHPRVLNNIRYYTLLDWVDAAKNKIAYCAAWGNGIYPTNTKQEIEIIAEYIKRFDSFSVREETSAQTAKTVFGRDANRVMDPVFLCGKEELDRLASKSKRGKTPANYLFSYMLDTSKANCDAIKEVADSFDLDIISVCSLSMCKRVKTEPGWTLKTEANVALEDWIAYAQNCKYMVTDSFHGLCLALIFSKPFLVITRPMAGNDRYYSLLGALGLLQHIVEDPKVITRKEFIYPQINYRNIQQTIFEQASLSYKWLEQSLSTKKKHNATDNLSDLHMFDDICFKDNIKAGIMYCFDDMRRFNHWLGRYIRGKKSY